MPSILEKVRDSLLLPEGELVQDVLWTRPGRARRTSASRLAALGGGLGFGIGAALGPRGGVPVGALGAGAGAAFGSVVGNLIDKRHAPSSPDERGGSGPRLLVLTSERILVVPATARGVPRSAPTEALSLAAITDVSTIERTRLGLTMAPTLVIRLAGELEARSFVVPGSMTPAKAHFVEELRSLAQRAHS